MKEQLDPRQLTLYPELSNEPLAPSITTLPEFDRALNNLIKMSDIGAFIQLNIHGIERQYTLNLLDYDIPKDFLNEKYINGSVTIPLFPVEIVQKLKKVSYEIKSFFNAKNSFRTSFGYFLFRSHFTMWKHYLDETKKNIHDVIYHELGHGAYGKYFLNHFEKGYQVFQNAADITAPWEFQDRLLLKDIEARRKQFTEHQARKNDLRPTDINYPFDVLVLKTLHIPLTLQQYIQHIQISSVFKTIHLEDLANEKIDSVEDIKNLIKSL